MKGNNSDPIAYAVWFQFLAGTLLLIFTILHGFKLPNNPRSIAINLFLTPILYTGMTIFIFKALQFTEASIFTILFNARVIIVVLLAMIFLKNPFTLQQIIGTILILGSVIAVSFKKSEFKLQKGEIFSLLAGVFLAFGVINDSFILKKFDAVTYSALEWFGPAILIWALYPKKTNEILTLPKTGAFLKIGILSLIYGTGYLSYNLAYLSGNNAARIAAIFPITSVLTILIAVIFLKERDHLLKKLFAAIIGFIGILFVS